MLNMSLVFLYFSLFSRMFCDNYTLNTVTVYNLLGVCIPRPSALGPHLVGPQPPKYCKNKSMNKAYYLLEIILNQH